jgi:hypothetical protein
MANLPAAKQIYEAWKAGVPLAAGISVADLDDFVKGIPPPDIAISEYQDFYPAAAEQRLF